MGKGVEIKVAIHLIKVSDIIHEAYLVDCVSLMISPLGASLPEKKETVHTCPCVCVCVCVSARVGTYVHAGVHVRTRVRVRERSKL